MQAAVARSRQAEAPDAIYPASAPVTSAITREAAALTIAGQPTPYVAKPWFWSDQYDIKLQIAGLNQGYDRVVTRGPGPSGDYSVWYFEGGKLLAVDAMNAAAAYMVGKRLIESGMTVSPERVADLSQDMKSWLKG